MVLEISLDNGSTVLYTQEMVSKQNLQTGVTSTVSHTVNEIDFLCFMFSRGAFSNFQSKMSLTFSRKEER